MLECNITYICDKCLKEVPRKFVLHNQKDRNMRTMAPPGWTWFEIYNFHFLVCDRCIIDIVTPMLGRSSKYEKG